MLKQHSPKKHTKSFKYAFSGIWHTLLNEANFRVQIGITITVLYLGYYFKVSTTEFAILVISVGLLLIAEMVNTVIENFIDVLIKEYHEGAKVIKDVSAGFVLLTAFITVVNVSLILGKPFLLFFL